MSDVADVLPFTDALLAALKTIGRPIGDSAKPSSPNPPPTSFYPYANLYVGTANLDGTLVHPNEDGVHVAQVTSIAKERRGAEWMRHRVREVVLAGDIDLGGYGVVWAELVTGQPVTRDDDVDPALFYAVDIFHLYVTPVSGS